MPRLNNPITVTNTQTGAKLVFDFVVEGTKKSPKINVHRVAKDNTLIQPANGVFTGDDWAAKMAGQLDGRAPAQQIEDIIRRIKQVVATLPETEPTKPSKPPAAPPPGGQPVGNGRPRMVDTDPEEPQPKRQTTPSKQKDPCPCPDCFDTYSKAVNAIVGNVVKVLDNTKVQIDGCTSVSGGADEPGCLKQAYYQCKFKQNKYGGTSRTKPITQIIDASAVQPNNKNTLGRTSKLNVNNEELLRELFTTLGIEDTDFMSNDRFTPNVVQPSDSRLSSIIDGTWGPDPETGKFSMKRGKYRLRIDSKADIRIADGGCEAILNLWKARGDKSPGAPKFEKSFTDLAPQNQHLSDNFPALLDYCCKLNARVMLQEGNLNKGIAKLDDFRLRTIVDEGGATTDHCSMASGSTIDLKNKIACCLNETNICPGLECETDTVSKIDETIQQLKQISDRSSPTCINSLVDEIKTILYGSAGDQPTTGLYYKLIRFMLIDHIFSSDGGKNAFNQPWAPWTGAADANVTPCSTQILGTLGMVNVDPGVPLVDVAAVRMNDRVLQNTYSEFLDAYNISLTPVPCDTPTDIYVKLKDITIDGESLITKYGDLVAQLRQQLQAAIQQILTTISDPDLETTEQEKQRCRNVEANIKKIEKELEEINREIQNLTTEKQSIQKDIDKYTTELNNAKNADPRDKWELPSDPTSGSKPGCDAARAEYDRLMIEERGARNTVTASETAVESISTDLAVSRSTMSRYNTILATISGIPQSRMNQLADPSVGQQVPNYPPAGESWLLLKSRVLGLKTNLETKIKQQEKTYIETRANLVSARNALTDVLKRLSNQGQKVIQDCNYQDRTDFKPITNTEVDAGGRYNAIKNTLDRLNEIKENIQDSIDAKSRTYSDRQTTLTLLKQQKITSCGAGAINLKNCLFTCVYAKSAELIDQLSVIRLKGWDLDQKPGSLGDCKENEVGTGDTLFVATLQAAQFAQKMKEVLDGCLESPNQPDPQGPLNPCKDLGTKIESNQNALNALKTAVTAEENSIKQKDYWIQAMGSAHQTIDINSLITVVEQTIRDMKVAKNNTPRLQQKFKIDQTIAQLHLDQNIELTLKHFTYSTITKIRTLQISEENLEKNGQILAEAKQSCEALQQNTRRCDTFLAQRREEIQNAFNVLMSDTNNAWNNFIQLARQLLSEEGNAGNSLKILRDKVREYVMQKLSEQCFDTRFGAPGKSNPEVGVLACPATGGPGPGGHPLPGPWKSTMENGPDGQPQPGSGFHPVEGCYAKTIPYAPISDDDISLVCNGITKKYDLIKVTVKLIRLRYWEREHPMNKFWQYVTSILNRTVLCKTKACAEQAGEEAARKAIRERKSLLHDLFCKIIEQSTICPPDPADDELFSKGKNRRGPRWIPGVGTKFNSCDIGPYFFPPPNDIQTKAAVVGGDPAAIENACPNHCTHVPLAPQPGERFSILRRMYYELTSIMEYLENIEALIEATVLALEQFKPALAFCSNKSNKDKKYLETTDGQKSWLNPDIHNSPIADLTLDTPDDIAIAEAAAKALIKVALNTKQSCECKDLITGD